MPVVNYDWDELEDNIVEEYDDAGATIADYTTEPDHFGNVISQHRSGQSSFFHYDAQGSTLAVTDDNQNVTDTRAYSAFGETTEATGTTSFPFQYIGQKGYYRDSLTRQYLVRTNAYEPVEARWSSPLSLGLNPGTEQYVFWANAPNQTAKPGALPQGTAAFCKVALACLSLSPPWIVIPSVKHCGLRVSDSTGVIDYNVRAPTAGLAGDLCTIVGFQVFPLGVEYARYHVYAWWNDPTGGLCKCIHAKVIALNTAALPYYALPANTVEIDPTTDKCADGQPMCNSNYATHCIMKSCRLDYEGGYFVAPGWNHRIKKCAHIEESQIHHCKSCRCLKWGPPVDGAWCANPPFDPIKPQPQSGSYPI
jgi:hypothetical protein